MKKFNLLVFLLIALFFISCEHEIPLSESEKTNTEVSNIAYKSSEIFNDNPSYLEEMILKLATKYDGDTEILLHYMNTNFKQQLGWSKENYLLYEFRMPYANLFTMEDIETKGLLIAYLQNEKQDDQKIKQLEAYTLDGQKTILTRENAKLQPYVILAPSDRIKNDVFTFGKYKGMQVKDFLLSKISSEEIKKGYTDTKNRKNFSETETWKNQKISDLEEDLTSVLRHQLKAPDIDDEEYWGIHYCESWGERFCFERPCKYNGPPPPPKDIFVKNADYSSTIKLYLKEQTTGSLPGVKIKNIRIKSNLDDDGYAHWLDGELELVITFYQTAISSLSYNIGPISGQAHFGYRDLYIYKRDHDWHNDCTYSVNATKPLSNLQSFQIPFTDKYLFNHKINIKVTETDTWVDDVYVDTDINLEPFFSTYNNQWYWPHNKIGFLLELGNYTNFN